MFTLKRKKLTKEAQYILDIVARYSEKNDVKKLISPISEEYFLIDDANQIYICVSDGKIVFSNHIFLYEKNFTLSFTDSLKKKIKENIEQEMQRLKNSLFKNETELLDKILSLAEGKIKPQVISPDFKLQAK